MRVCWTVPFTLYSPGCSQQALTAPSVCSRTRQRPITLRTKFSLSCPQHPSSSPQAPAVGGGQGPTIWAWSHLNIPTVGKIAFSGAT